MECTNCKGTGFENNKYCSNCNGTGETTSLAEIIRTIIILIGGSIVVGFFVSYFL